MVERGVIFDEVIYVIFIDMYYRQRNIRYVVILLEDMTRKGWYPIFYIKQTIH